MSDHATSPVSPHEPASRSRAADRVRIALTVAVGLAACTAALLIDNGQSINSRLPALIAIAIIARLALLLVFRGRASGRAGKPSMLATALILIVLAAVSLPIITAML